MPTKGTGMGYIMLKSLNGKETKDTANTIKEKMRNRRAAETQKCLPMRSGTTF